MIKKSMDEETRSMKWLTSHVIRSTKALRNTNTLSEIKQINNTVYKAVEVTLAYIKALKTDRNQNPNRSDKGEAPDNHTTLQYIWHTASDNKVRDRHAANDGKIFSWNNPSNGVHPGEDYNCRCWAEPYEPLTIAPKTPKRERESGVNAGSRYEEERFDDTSFILPKPKPENLEIPVTEYSPYEDIEEDISLKPIDVGRRVRKQPLDPSTPKPSHEIRTSPEGVEFILNEEDFKERAYRVPDNQGKPSGNPTIGYGHDIRNGETFPDKITAEEAEVILDKDLRNAEQAVRRHY